MNVWFVSPAWKRYDVTELALAQRRWLCDHLATQGLTARGVIVGDDGNLAIAEKHGFDVVEFPNDRGLGAKFNEGFRYALDQGADYIVHIGSDDWVHPDIFADLPEPWQTGDEVPFPKPGERPTVRRAGPVVRVARGLAIMSLLTQQGFVFDARRVWGTVPWILPRAVFEGIEHPVDPGIMFGVEHSLVTNLGTCNWVQHPSHSYMCVDWKSSVNVTTYDFIKDWYCVPPSEDVWDGIAARYPAHLVEMARLTSAKLREEEAADG